MSSRISLRRKAVLPVTIIRRNGSEKKHAHTLDITETSARLAGLSSLLEVGEIIEIQRGVVKAKFEVFWMGALGSPVAGQAGIRSIEPNKRIWGVNLEPDETDLIVDAERMRDPMSAFGGTPQYPGDKRRNARYGCSGGVSIRTASAMFAIHGEGKDISTGGIYVELMHPVPVNTHVTLNLAIDGIGVEASGIVRTSYPLVGMGIGFSNISDHNRERIALIVKKAQQSSAGATSVSSARLAELAPERNSRVPLPPLDLHTYPTPVLANACKMLADCMDSWKSLRSAEEIEQVREAVSLLHEKLLLTVAPIELLDYFTGATPQNSLAQ